ncbi:Uncharacterised protein [uncultured archaeon]|nr:Uncharacterised protein [uncultured archaeon]
MAVTLPEEIVKRLDLREGLPIRVFEVTAGTVAFEKVKMTTLSEDDIIILKKLLQFKFEERTPERIDQAFTAPEKRRIADLIRRHLISIYYGGKYQKSGVYNVPTLVYRQYLQQTAQAESKPTAPAAIPHVEYKSQAAAKPVAAASSARLTPIQALEKNGFLIMQSEADAKEFSDSYASRIRKKEIFGIRGFDKKYYIVKSSFVAKNESKVRAFLKDGAKSADKVAEALGVETQGAIALLTIMNEEGELIEKKRGTFALAD